MEKVITLALDGVRIERILGVGIRICTTDKEWDAIELSEEQYKGLRRLINTVDVAESCMADNDGQRNRN